jgi:hypothetical protein
VLGHDLGVVRGAGRAGDLLDQAVEVEGAADLVEIFPTLELLPHGDQVHGLPAAVDGEHGLEGLLVGRTVEVLGLDHLDHGGEGLRREHHGAEHRLLGLQVVGRDAGGSRPTGLLRGPRHLRLLDEDAA